MCCCRRPAVLQEALCNDVDSLTTLCRLGKSSGGSAVDTRLLLKGPIFYQFSDVFFGPGECRAAELPDKLFKKLYLFLSSQLLCSVGGQKERPAEAARCRQSFVMSQRADFQCSTCWWTVEESDWSTVRNITALK